MLHFFLPIPELSIHNILEPPPEHGYKGILFVHKDLFFCTQRYLFVPTSSSPFSSSHWSSPSSPLFSPSFFWCHIHLQWPRDHFLPQAWCSNWLKNVMFHKFWGIKKSFSTWRLTCAPSTPVWTSFSVESGLFVRWPAMGGTLIHRIWQGWGNLAHTRFTVWGALFKGNTGSDWVDRKRWGGWLKSFTELWISSSQENYPLSKHSNEVPRTKQKSITLMASWFC